jgi:ketosteroid isomerase-like protein
MRGLGGSGSFVVEMMDADVELARRAYARFDLSSTPDWDLFADDFIFQPSVTGSETTGQRYVGKAGWRNYQEAAWEVWSSLTVEVQHLRSVRPGVVLAEGETHGVGRSSGAPVTRPHFAVVRIREGRIAEFRVFQTLDEALSFAATILD